jgi:drug/metabolite transporter (DMT)-like permease
MVKSCAPVFVMIFAFAFRLEKPTVELSWIIVLILFGVVLTVWDAFSFSLLGFTLVFGAAIVSGLRWTLTQLIIENSTTEDIDEDSVISKSGPLRIVVYLAPIIGTSLLALSFIFEGPNAVLTSPFFATGPIALRSFGFCIFGGFQTFALVLLEYKVVQETSVLTFSVVGVIKELLIIGISVLLFGDQLKLVNITGALISIVGILLYNLYKVRRKAQGINGDDRRRRRAAGTAMQNMFMAVPTSETGWLIDPLAASEEDINGNILVVGSIAPQPTPVTVSNLLSRRGFDRRYSLWEPRVNTFETAGGSLRSTRTASPARQANGNSLTPIELGDLP